MAPNIFLLSNDILFTSYNMGLGSRGVFSSSSRLRQDAPKRPERTPDIRNFVTKKEHIPTPCIQNKKAEHTRPSIAIHSTLHLGWLQSKYRVFHWS